MIAHENQIVLNALRQRYYFSVLEEKFILYRAQYGMPTAVNYITEAMRLSLPQMDDLIRQRQELGEINDAAQARKSLAGNGFQAMVFLALATMQEEGQIPPTVIFSLKPKTHPIIEGYAAIRTGDETLKPDLDLLAYAKNSNVVTIYSLKTSLRERAGQTHRWKLLLDIVTAKDSASLRKKYKLTYKMGRQFVMGLITTNFYDEITSPQQRGLLNFFDHVYLTKPGHYAAPVLNFSHIGAHLRALYDR